MSGIKYIRIRYGNSCDFAGLRFSGGELFDVYFDGVLSRPEIKHDEYADENENKAKTFKKRVMTKSIILVVMADEWMISLLNFIKLCDYKQMTDKAGVNYTIEDMTIEGQISDGVARVEVSMIIERIVWNSCCVNTQLLDCNYYNYTYVDVITTAAPLFTNPQSVPIGTKYVIYDTVTFKSYLAERAQGGEIINYWNRILLTGNQIAKKSGTSGRYMRDINAVVGSYDILPVPYIRSITPDDTDMIIEGQAPEGYDVQINVSTDDITYSGLGVYYTAESLNQDGITIPAASLEEYVMLSLHVRHTHTECCTGNMYQIPT